MGPGKGTTTRPLAVEQRRDLGLGPALGHGGVAVQARQVLTQGGRHRHHRAAPVQVGVRLDLGDDGADRVADPGRGAHGQQLTQAGDALVEVVLGRSGDRALLGGGRPRARGLPSPGPPQAREPAAEALDAVPVDGLDDVGRAEVVHGVDERGLDVSGEDHRAGGRARKARALDDVEPRPVGQLEIDEESLPRTRFAQRRIRAGHVSHDDRLAEWAHHAREAPPDEGIVLDHEEARPRAHVRSARGARHASS